MDSNRDEEVVVELAVNEDCFVQTEEDKKEEAKAKLEAKSSDYFSWIVDGDWVGFLVVDIA